MCCMSAYLLPGKELAVLALSRRSNPREGGFMCVTEIVLLPTSSFVAVILKDYVLK